MILKVAEAKINRAIEGKKKAADKVRKADMNMDIAIGEVAMVSTNLKKQASDLDKLIEKVKG